MVTPTSWDNFYNPNNESNCLVVKFGGEDAEPLRDLNRAIASRPDVFPKGIDSGFNGDKFAAHVTIAYYSGTPIDLTKLPPPSEALGSFKIGSIQLLMSF